MTIWYLCPDITIKSAGVRILYRHVEVLTQHGLPASILHFAEGFRLPDMPKVRIGYITARPVQDGDIIVISEGYPQVMQNLSGTAVRRIVIALNWRYIYATLPDQIDWRDFGVERVISHSDFIADFVGWSMGLPTHVFRWAINDKLYFNDPADRIAQVTFITRKAPQIEELKRVLRSRRAEFVERITWLGLDGVSEIDYAREIRRSRLFLNLSPAEGLPCSLLEAMRAGTLVAGYNSVGGQRELIGSGPQQNCILAENTDYVALALALEPVLHDILRGDMSNWSGILENAANLSAVYTEYAETNSVVAVWREILAAH